MTRLSQSRCQCPANRELYPVDCSGKRAAIIVPYRKKGKVIEVLRVYYAARLWPDKFS